MTSQIYFRTAYTRVNADQEETICTWVLWISKIKLLLINSLCCVFNKLKRFLLFLHLVQIKCQCAKIPI